MQGAAHVCTCAYVCETHTYCVCMWYLHNNKATMAMIKVNRRQETSIKRNTPATAAPTIIGIKAGFGGVGSESSGVGDVGDVGGAGVVLNKNSVSNYYYADRVPGKAYPNRNGSLHSPLPALSAPLTLTEYTTPVCSVSTMYCDLVLSLVITPMLVLVTSTWYITTHS